MLVEEPGTEGFGVVCSIVILFKVSRESIEIMNGTVDDLLWSRKVEQRADILSVNSEMALPIHMTIRYGDGTDRPKHHFPFYGVYNL